MDMITVVIPAYKKTSMLVENLTHNLRFLKETEVIVVNDDPEESIAQDIKDLPVVLVENSRNLGFAGAVNTGFKRAKHSQVMLLNSDVKLYDDSWKKALERINHNKEYFAVSFAQKESDGSTVGKNSIYWSNGFFLHKKSEDMHAGPTAWAEGGSCIINKTAFEQLGGFDEIYSPYYWEDIDLSYRAWKAGYKVMFDPAVLVEHHHESTIGTYFKKRAIERIATRNQFVFIWKNMERTMLISHFIRLPLFLLATIVNRQTTLGFISALFRIPTILRKRRSQQQHYKFRDPEILKLFE